jgi:Polyketide cyclase / dehydrase and lipid transport
MAEVHLRQRCDVTADALWAHIGDFHAINRWWPVIVHCEPINDGRSRQLQTAMDQNVVETLLAQEDRSYTYRVDQVPLPIDNYTSTIAVSEEPDGACVVTWDSTFRCVGITEHEGTTLMTDYLQTGIDAIALWTKTQNTV